MLRKLDVRLVLVFVLSQVGVWTGCNAILGNGYGAFDETAGNGASPEGSAEGDALVGGGDGGPGGNDGTAPGDGSAGDGNIGDAAGCPRGICPTMLTAATGPQRIAVGMTDVYWSSAVGVGRVGQDGTGSKTLDLGGAIGATLKRGVAVSPGGVPYVTVVTRGAAKCATDLSGCGVGFIGSAGDSSSVAVDASKVYVGIFDDQSGSMLGGIWQTDLNGASPLPYTMMTDKVLDLRIAGAYTFYRTAGAIQADSRTTAPFFAASLGGQVPVAFDVTNPMLVIATANKHLLTCVMSPPATCAPNVVQITASVPSAVIFDGTHIIWAEEGVSNGSIHRCDFPDCLAPELLAEGQASPSDLAVLGSSIYWANHGDGAGAGGAIMKLPK